MAAPQLPAAGSLLPDAGNDIEVTQRLEDWLAVTRQLPGAALATTLTLDGNTGGRAVATGARHRVDTFGGASSGTMAKLGTDNVAPGRRVKLSCASSLRPVTLLHAGGGTEQFFLAAGVAMALASDTATIELELQADGWHEVDRWWGTQGGYFRDWIGVKTQATYDLASQAEAEAGGLDTRMMSALKVRQAIVAPSWVASLPVVSAVNPTNALLLYDGTRLWRAAAGAVVGQAPTKRFATTVPVFLGDFGEYAHNLGGMPPVVRATLLCAVADHGYLVGQEVASGDLWVYASATVVGWTTAAAVAILDGSGNYVNITPARWNIVLRAYA